MNKQIKKIIYLPEKYDLVVGDRFELFYRGVLRLINPYNYNIRVSCLKGKPYPRYFWFTPTNEDVGEYELKIEILDDFDNLLDSDCTKLIVRQEKDITKKINLLCIGDSLTSAGYWTLEGYRRIKQGVGDVINFIGLCDYEKDDLTVQYEGYGGWQWKTFCANNVVSKTSSIWIWAKHRLTQADQHSVWSTGNNEWIVETIETDRIKFKRGNKNYLVSPKIDERLVHVRNAICTDDIIIDRYDFEFGNPFWNDEINDIDFDFYLKKNNFVKPDYIYIMLTWNGLYIPYADSFPNHEPYATHIIDKLHSSFPKAKIICFGIPLNSINGGIANNYGASGPYSDWYGTLTTCLNYNRWLEIFTEKYEFCEYVDVKGQFDVENNMPAYEEKVNNRNDIKERIGNNGVHPAMSGYMQIGDVFYRSLVKIINDLVD